MRGWKRAAVVLAVLAVIGGVGVPVGVHTFRTGVVYRPVNPMPTSSSTTSSSTTTTAPGTVSYLTPPSSLFSSADPFTTNGVTTSNDWYFLGPQSGGVTGLPFSQMEVVVPPGCTGSSMTWQGATGVPCPS